MMNLVGLYFCRYSKTETFLGRRKPDAPEFLQAGRVLEVQNNSVLVEVFDNHAMVSRENFESHVLHKKTFPMVQFLDECHFTFNRERCQEFAKREIERYFYEHEPIY